MNIGDTVKIVGFHLYEGITGVIVKIEPAYIQIQIPSGGILCADKDSVIKI